MLALVSVAFLPFFFFASVYAQVSLGKTASNAGVYILYFFLGYVIASLIGGRMLDRRGARPPIVIGSALAAVGFYLLAGKLTDLSLSAQTGSVMLAGAGIGLMLTPASTDAVSRASRASYSEVTGITQTARYFGASLGLAALGTILLSETRTRVTDALTSAGVPRASADTSRDRSRRRAPAPAPVGRRRARTRARRAARLRTLRCSRSSTRWPACSRSRFLIALVWLPRGRLDQSLAPAPAPELVEDA